MKVTQNTTGNLVINTREKGGFALWLVLFLGAIWVLLVLPQHDPPIWVLLMFSIFPIIFGLMTLLSARRSQLVLSRTEGTATLRRRFFFTYRKRHFDLSDVDCLYFSRAFDTEAAIPDLDMAYLTLRVHGGMDEGSYAINTYVQPRTMLDPIRLAANIWLDRPQP